MDLGESDGINRSMGDSGEAGGRERLGGCRDRAIVHVKVGHSKMRGCGSLGIRPMVTYKVVYSVYCRPCELLRAEFS